MKIYKTALFLFTNALAFPVFGMVSHGFIVNHAQTTQVEQKTTYAVETELTTLPAFVQFQRDVKKQTTDRLKFYAEQEEDLKIKDAVLEELLEREQAFFTNKQYADSIKTLELVARHGSKHQVYRAHYRLASIYFSIKEVQDYKLARTYLEHIKQQTINTSTTWFANVSAWASNQLGRIYSRDDFGVKHDYAQAFRHYSFSANLSVDVSKPSGLADNKICGLNNLGICYAHGYGVKKDLKKARDYFTIVIQYTKEFSHNEWTAETKAIAEAFLKQFDEQEAMQAAQ